MRFSHISNYIVIYVVIVSLSVLVRVRTMKCIIREWGCHNFGLRVHEPHLINM